MRRPHCPLARDEQYSCSWRVLPPKKGHARAPRSPPLLLAPSRLFSLSQTTPLRGVFGASRGSHLHCGALGISSHTSAASVRQTCRDRPGFSSSAGVVGPPSPQEVAATQPLVPHVGQPHDPTFCCIHPPAPKQRRPCGLRDLRAGRKSPPPARSPKCLKLAPQLCWVLQLWCVGAFAGSRVPAPSSSQNAPDTAWPTHPNVPQGSGSDWLSPHCPLGPQTPSRTPGNPHLGLRRVSDVQSIKIAVSLNS